MKTSTRNTVLALLTALTVSSFAASAAVAAPPQPLLLPPGQPTDPFFPLPKFGFASYTIYNYGERVTFVKWNGLAAQMGLEPGDVILSLNGYPLTYHGAWNDALRQALLSGGWVTLKIRDVNTGFIAYRQTFVGGGYGPIVENYMVHCPTGPVTPHVVHKHHHGNNVTVLDIVKFFKDKKKP